MWNPESQSSINDLTWGDKILQTWKEHAVTLFHRETSLVKALNQSYFSEKNNKCPESISGHQWDFPNSKAHASSAQCARLRVVPHFSSGIVEPAKHERAWKSPHARKGVTPWGERKMRFSLPAACHLFSRGMIFTRARVSLSLLSLRKNRGLLVVYQCANAFIEIEIVVYYF